MTIIEMRTATITDKGQISIPREIRELEHFTKGSKVAIIAFDDHVEIRPLKEFNEKLFPAFATEKVLSRDWLSKEEDEAWKDL